MIAMIDKAILLRYVIECLLVVPAGIIAFLPLYKSMRDRSLFSIISITLLVIVIAVMSAMVCARYRLDTTLVMLPLYPLFFILYSSMISKSLVKKLFCYLNAVLFTGFCTMYTGFAMANVEQFNTDPVRTLPTALVCLIAAFFTALIFYITVSKELAAMLEDELLNNIWNWMIFIPLVFAAVVIFATPRNFEVIMGGRIQEIGLVSMLLIPIATLIAYHLVYVLSSRLKDYSRLQQENTLLKLEERRYEQIRNFMEQSRAVRHDFRQHLLAISGLAQRNENEKLLDYISPLLNKVESSNKHFCANITVDAVAAHYDSIADAQNTTIDWTLDLPSELPIHDSDVCSILGNFLENALRAVKELPESQRTITAAASMLSEETLGISVKNPFNGTVKFRKNGLPRNTRAGHGIGLQSVAMIAERYNGSLSLTANGGVFSAGVLLYTEHNGNTVS